MKDFQTFTIDIRICHGHRSWTFPGLHFIRPEMTQSFPLEQGTGPQVTVSNDDDEVVVDIEYLADRRGLYFKKLWTLYVPGRRWETMVPEPTRRHERRLGRTWSCAIRRS